MRLPPRHLRQSCSLLEYAPKEMIDLAPWLRALPPDQFVAVAVLATIDAATRPFHISHLSDVLHAIEARFGEIAGLLAEEPTPATGDHE